MNPPRIDLVVERLVIAGIDLTPDQAAELGALVEDALRTLVVQARVPATRTVGLAEATPTGLAHPVDHRSLARVVAERIVSQAGLA